MRTDIKPSCVQDTYTYIYILICSIKHSSQKSSSESNHINIYIYIYIYIYIHIHILIFRHKIDAHRYKVILRAHIKSFCQLCRTESLLVYPLYMHMILKCGLYMHMIINATCLLIRLSSACRYTYMIQSVYIITAAHWLTYMHTHMHTWFKVCISFIFKSHMI